MKQVFSNNYSQLAIDLANNNLHEFSAQGLTRDQTEDILRKEMFEAVGLDPSKGLTRRQYEIYKNQMFQVIEETISPIINDTLERAMGEFAEVRNIAFGDSLIFDIENPDLFEVAVIAQGTSNLRRQRMSNGKMTVDIDKLGIKVYDEFYRFLCGRVNWTQVVDKVVKSYERHVATLVNKALFDAYNTIDPTFTYTGTYDEDQIIRVASAVEAQYGSAVIIGTKSALRPLKPSYVGDSVKDTYNTLGHVGIFNSFRTIALEQSFAPGTFDFNLSPTDLLVLPANGERFVKIVTEGTAFIHDEQNRNGDQSIEHTFEQGIGVGIALAREYGIMKLS